MDDELSRIYRRWQEAEEADRDDDAESAFRRMLAAAEGDAVPAAFAAQTMERVAAASAADAVWLKRTRRAAIAAAVVGGIGLAYFGSGLIASMTVGAITRMLDLAVNLVVGAARSGQNGGGAWSVLTSLGRAAAAFAADPFVTLTILAIQAAAIAALVTLQRLLGSDWESSK